MTARPLGFDVVIQARVEEITTSSVCERLCQLVSVVSCVGASSSCSPAGAPWCAAVCTTVLMGYEPSRLDDNHGATRTHTEGQDAEAQDRSPPGQGRTYASA